VTRFGRWAAARRARRDEGGSAVVEAAIIIPIITLLTFGAIEYGIAFRESAGVKAASRAGARTASAMPRNEMYLESTAKAVSSAVRDLGFSDPVEMWVYHAPTTGGKPATCGTQCARFTWDEVTDSFVQTSGTPWLASEQNACASASDPNLPQQIGIYVKARHDFVTGLFGAGSDLTSITVMRLEPFVGVGSCSS
jgi:hypothetical protein